jgi:hypothetical protein
VDLQLGEFTKLAALRRVAVVIEVCAAARHLRNPRTPDIAQ